MFPVAGADKAAVPEGASAGMFQDRLRLTLYRMNFKYLKCVQTGLGKAFSPVCLVAPVQIMNWLGQYHEHCEEILAHFK